ncbi:YceI family protein [Flavobacterium sp. NKUCC04_CG]|uniref:YceI family protein n=1 Tax=Flavobacterium sp. NKUCC04_CG TaxID=2842121 RepID=UPI001C5B2EAA|nr:YceI family protein [Flavobacterium sp. NKUCC04_CG]MBW3518720.1 YceI family protein [Flavobacterium sp. NKUCC04_CG]
MKKKLLTLALIGALVVSCGKKEETKVEQLYPTEVTPVSEQKVNLDYTLEWTAFKTPKKVGVKGTFDKMELTDVKEAATLIASLEGAKFTVETPTVNSKDPLRDDKLKAGFFAKMAGNITGSFGAFKDGKVAVSITMNGVTKEKIFAYESTDTSVKINGSIDMIADFSANAAFDSIHELCKDLHEGKTWTDVDIAVEIKK